MNNEKCWVFNEKNNSFITHYLYPLRLIDNFSVKFFGVPYFLYPLTRSFELRLELSELCFCEGFWTMCSWCDATFVHGLGDYKDYFLMASSLVKSLLVYIRRAPHLQPLLLVRSVFRYLHLLNQ